MGNQLQAEWAFVTGAPLLSFAFVILAVAVVWAIHQFLYRHRIEALKEEVERERREVARLEAKQEDKPESSVQEGKQADTRTISKARERQYAQLQIDNARAEARGAMSAFRDVRTAERAVVTMESALLTAKKVYGIETPKASGDHQTDLQTWLRFFDAVWPLLAHNHDEEGRAKAAQLTKRFDAQLLEPPPP